MTKFVPAMVPTVNAWSQKLQPTHLEKLPCRTEIVYRPANPETSSTRPRNRVRGRRYGAKHYLGANWFASPNYVPSSDFDDGVWFWQTQWSGSDINTTFEATCPSTCSSTQAYMANDPDCNVLSPWPQTLLPTEVISLVLSKSEIAKKVEGQLQYYFSRSNLIKDVHLRSMFDPADGTVPLSELIKFAKLRNLLGLDIEWLVKIVRNCDFVELFEDEANVANSRVRTPDWKFWLSTLGLFNGEYWQKHTSSAQ